jgi:hypothetical protein
MNLLFCRKNKSDFVRVWLSDAADCCALWAMMKRKENLLSDFPQNCLLCATHLEFEEG